MSKTPITDAAEYEVQEAFESYEGLSSAPTKVVNPENMRALEIQYNNALKIIANDCDTDSRAREIALKVLPEIEVYGDSYGVPTLFDVIEKLVKKINE